MFTRKSATRRPVRTLAVLGAAAALATSAIAVAPAAQAAVSFQVTYTVASQWGGGFVANVDVKNTGDAVSGWTVGWTFPESGQNVTNGWSAAVTQSGTAVTATNVAYNGSLASGATASFGFQGTWTASNPIPSSFTVNGVPTGGTTTTTTTTRPTTTIPTTTATTTSRPTTTTTTTTTSRPTTTSTTTTTTTTTTSRPTTTTTSRPTTTTTTTTTSSGTATVAKDGTGTYTSVQAAINAVPSNNTSRRVITIKPGTYREIVTIPSSKPYITLQGLGSSASQTVLVYNNYAALNGTFNSASAFISGHDFTATNLTFSNDFDEGSHDGTSGEQAVALNLSADRATFNNVRFLGDQDTLLVNSGARSYFVNSYIEGTVDFIFGNGIAVFDASSIYEKRSTGGPITAARTPSDSTYGFLFYKSTITGATNNTTQLGRPWGPYAQVVYRESNLSATIATAQPWIDMSSNSWQNARFSEYKNTGSGATTNSNRKQLTDSQAANYTPQKYLAGSDGWNPM